MRFRFPLHPIDLELTLTSGQAFRWVRSGPGWQGVVRSRVVHLRQLQGGLFVDAPGAPPELPDQLAAYFRIQDDLPTIHRALRTDAVLRSVLSGLEGVRLLQQDSWETAAGFLLATYANFPRICGMVERLAAALGEPLEGGRHAFPAPDVLASASVSELRSLGVGYRAPLLSELAKAWQPELVRELLVLPYEPLHRALRALPGIGPKVADCIALYGFGRLEAFPIDVWIGRAMARHFGLRGSYAKVQEAARRRFGPYAGYAQQLLYIRERERSFLARRTRPASSRRRARGSPPRAPQARQAQ